MLIFAAVIPVALVACFALGLAWHLCDVAARDELARRHPARRAARLRGWIARVTDDAYDVGHGPGCICRICKGQRQEMEAW